MMPAEEVLFLLIGCALLCCLALTLPCVCIKKQVQKHVVLFTQTTEYNLALSQGQPLYSTFMTKCRIVIDPFVFEDMRL